MEFKNFYKESTTNFDIHDFLGRWFMSKKKTIPKEWFEYLAEKYPYKGTAFRLDIKPYDAPYTSWCKTLDGLIEWKATMNPLGRTPEGWHNYRGMIVKGIDLVEVIKDNKVEKIYEPMVRVEEVCPIVPVKNVKDIDFNYKD